MLATLRQYYRRQDLWSLFLICAFPQHIWTLALALRDVPWLTERTDAWDAFGVVSYGLVFAFFESLVIFIALALLGFLISPRWTRNTRLVLLSALVLVLSVWAMAAQMLSLFKVDWPGPWVSVLIATGHPLWFASAAIFPPVIGSFVVPALFLLRSSRGTEWAQGLFERLSLLSVLYLSLDAIGLVIVVVRNIV